MKFVPSHVLFAFLVVGGTHAAVGIFLNGAICDEGPCSGGTFFNKSTKLCEPCSDGTYLSVEGHACQSCFPCTSPKSEQVIINPCTSRHDTVIGCQDGLFMTGVDVPEARYCQACSQCYDDEDMVMPCKGRQDTICAKKASTSKKLEPTETSNESFHSNEMVFTNDLCEEGPCMRGNYYNILTGECFPCQDGTFMEKDHHRCVDCGHCKRPYLDAHEVMVEDCTATSDTIIGCDDGYFQTKGMDPECEKCTTCKPDEIQVNPCGTHTDTICQQRETASTRVVLLEVDNKDDDHIDNANNKALNNNLEVGLIVVTFCFATLLKR